MADQQGAVRGNKFGVHSRRKDPEQSAGRPSLESSFDGDWNNKGGPAKKHNRTASGIYRNQSPVFDNLSPEKSTRKPEAVRFAGRDKDFRVSRKSVGPKIISKMEISTHVEQNVPNSQQWKKKGNQFRSPERVSVKAMEGDIMRRVQTYEISQFSSDKFKDKLNSFKLPKDSIGQFYSGAAKDNLRLSHQFKLNKDEKVNDKKVKKAINVILKKPKNRIVEPKANVSEIERLYNAFLNK